MRERRVAFVTGGAKGIGRAIAIKLAEKGFSIAVCYNKSEEAAFSLVVGLQKNGVNAIAVQADLTKYDQVERAYNEAKKHFGFIDTLINNAGISLIKPLCDCSESDYNFVMDSNFRSAFNTCKIFTPDMVSERFGRVVNIASVWGERGASTETLYSASKAALIGFSKALNAELAINGVIVNSVSPGFIDTDMNACFTEEEKLEFLQGVSLSRAGKPEEVASVVELLTKEELYIAGADIPVNGGIL
jgi:3-oxoacyl-[acyl-carrier protein] reductase